MTWPAKRQILAVLCIALIVFAAIWLDDLGGAAELAIPLLLFLLLVCGLVLRPAKRIILLNALPTVLDSRPPPVA